MCVVGEKNMSKILIVEDDEKLSKELKIFLDKNGYDSVILQKFDNAVEDILEENADLILLDINLPYTDGEYICKEIRKTSDVPIIMVTSRDNEMDELISLNYGADQYVTKPFNIQILLAKIAGLIKRNQNADKSQEKIKCNEFILNVSKSVIETENKKIELTKNELKILHYLVLNQGKIVSREEIMNYLNECYKPRMDEREIELCKEIVFNTIERIDEYVPLIEKNLKKSWSIDRLSMMEKAILYVAIYERNEVSKEISINQAVELAKKYCDEDAYKFINGVLGAIG